MKAVLIAGLCAFLSVSAAPNTFADEAIFSFSGKKGKPVKIIDHRDGDRVTMEEGIQLRNQSTSSARRAASSRAETAQEMRARLQGKDESTLRGNPEEDVTANEREELTPQEGLRLLREKNWITYTTDDKSFPKEVYNPATKLFVPTQEAIKSLQTPPQPATRVSLGTPPPPPPRKSDPTP